LLDFCQCQVEWGFEVCWTVKIQVFDDTFLRCKSRQGGYRVSYSSTLQLSCRWHSYGAYIYCIKW